VTGRAAPGPRVVALGGGHGLAVSLRAACQYAGHLTGVVSVGDDGGSSGRLRAELGVPAPGDVRRCLSALAGDDTLLARSLEHRFEGGPLHGHAVGNLLLAGLTVASGDFIAAVAEVARLVGARGELYPATVTPVTLVADSDAGTLVGQVTIEQAGGIRDLRFAPPDPAAPEPVVAAIETADQIVLGPGSLFTSVLATAVVPAIRRSLNRTGARRVYVANVANDKGLVRGFGLAEHLDAIAEHGVGIDVVLAPPDLAGIDDVAVPVHLSAVAREDGWGHDPDALAAALSELV
jgi:uncharacterized cofD-like protein